MFPGHSNKIAQSKGKQPSSYPDLIYELKLVLEHIALSKRLFGISQDINGSVANFTMDVLGKSIDDWPECIKAYIKAKGAYFK